MSDSDKPKVAKKEAINFNKTNINALKPETKRYYRYDTKVPQLGLYIHPSGTRSYFVRATINGKTQRIGIPNGKFPAMTPDVAREKAKQIIADAVNDISLIDTKKKERAKKELKTQQEVTLREMLILYIFRKELKESTQVMYYQKVLFDCKPYFDKPLTDITEDVINKINDSRGVKAATAIRYLKAIFNFARAVPEYKKLGLFKINPTDTLTEQKVVRKYKRRKTFLKKEELSYWMDAVDNLDTMHREYYLFMLFTGTRADTEAGSLRWEDINWRTNTFHLGDTKNGEEVDLPLPSYLIPLLKQRKQNSGRVFPITNHAETQRRQIQTESGVTFTRHDLRRTFLTVGASVDIAYLTVKRLANHADDANDVTADYIQTGPDDLKRASVRIENSILMNAGRLNADVRDIHA